MAENASEKQIQSCRGIALRPSVLIIPSLVKGGGTGHLQRSITIARDLGQNAVILIEKKAGTDSIRIDTILEKIGSERQFSIAYELPQGIDYDFILLDKPFIEKREVKEYNRIAPTIALDPGGPGRNSVSYVIDCLPRLSSLSPGNISDPGFLSAPHKIRDRRPQSFRRILISFGGEDEARLSSRLARTLIENEICTAESLSLVIGPSFARQTLPEGITVHEKIDDLKNELYRYDLVFTHFGLTAFEAVFASVPVILFNPSNYHRKLSKNYGFPEIGVKRPNKRTLKHFFFSPDKTAEICSSICTVTTKNLGKFIKSLARPQQYCPACGSSEYCVLERFERQSYCRCNSCRSYFLMSFQKNTIAYNKEYFFSEYRSHYGKTYVEDFDHIQALGRGRLQRIRAIIDPQKSKNAAKPLLLDVGCAYGPFLKAADREGFNVFGIDVSQEAIDFVTRKLGFPAVSQSFESIDVEKTLGVPQFDVITYWFVIEHFPDMRPILKKTADILAAGGILAVSTPNGAGISAKKDRRSFFRTSPADHYTISTPGSMRRILKQYGFNIIKIRNTGHHPERFPLHRLLQFKFFETLAMIVSKLLRLGDTFEMYAKKGP